jgi:predicted neuraminidase
MLFERAFGTLTLALGSCRRLAKSAVLAIAIALASAGTRAGEFESGLIFPLHSQHNHAPGVVECPNGDLLVSWYRGSGERKADDVAVLGARRRRGESRWSDPFVLADNADFPDGNTALFVDPRGRLWLFWPVILANTWESALTNYRISESFEGEGAPNWSWQGALYLEPKRFEDVMRQRLDERARAPGGVDGIPAAELEAYRARLGDKLGRRLGWQPRCKPTVLASGRIVMPLYTDTYSVSLMALSDDAGATWHASEPLAGFGNIQPAVLERKDGTLIAYMRENGPLGRIRVSESADAGETWSAVGVSDLVNPGSGLDAQKLASGHWLIVYNDTSEGRSSLAVSLSTDEGRSWSRTRHLERQAEGAFHYPAVTQGRDGRIHVVYSYFVAAGKSMKLASFDEAWLGEKPAAVEERGSDR